MSEKLRILVTGFGPFPGAPYNPTQALVMRRAAVRTYIAYNPGATSQLVRFSDGMKMEVPPRRLLAREQVR